MATINCKNDHGLFTVTDEALDIAIERYLPASIEALRKALDEVTGFYENQYDDVGSIGEALIMLADPIQGELNSAREREAEIAAAAALDAVRNNAHLGGAGMQAYDTHLGQIRVASERTWVDYARGTKDETRRWFDEDPQNRRVVDWIDKSKVIFGEGADNDPEN